MSDAPDAVPELTEEAKDAVVTEVAPGIVRAFTEAAGKPEHPAEPPPPDPVQMLTDAWERMVALHREDARLFPDHRGLAPGEGSGTA